MSNLTVLKMVFVGDVAVGKTSFIVRVADNEFTTQPTTVGVDFKVKLVDVKGQQVKLQLWDTAGQERFRTLTTSYFRGAHIVFLMYSIVEEESFKNLDHWKDEITFHSDRGARIYLIANKVDLGDQRAVSEEKGRIFADKNGYQYYEVSVKENLNVENVINAVCSEVLASSAPSGNAKVRDAVSLSTSKEQKKKKPSCSI